MQVGACPARPIFNCAARMCFEHGPRVRQVTLFLAMVQEFILHKTRRRVECSDHQFNDATISMICKSKVQLQFVSVIDSIVKKS